MTTTKTTLQEALIKEFRGAAVTLNGRGSHGAMMHTVLDVEVTEGGSVLFKVRSLWDSLWINADSVNFWTEDERAKFEAICEEHED